MIAVDEDRLERIRRFKQKQDARRCRRLLRFVGEHPGCTIERVAARLQVRTNTIWHDLALLDGRVHVESDERLPLRLLRIWVAR